MNLILVILKYSKKGIINLYKNIILVKSKCSDKKSPINILISNVMKNKLKILKKILFIFILFRDKIMIINIIISKGLKVKKTLVPIGNKSKDNNMNL